MWVWECERITPLLQWEVLSELLVRVTCACEWITCLWLVYYLCTAVSLCWFIRIAHIDFFLLDVLLCILMQHSHLLWPCNDLSWPLRDLYWPLDAFFATLIDLDWLDWPWSQEIHRCLQSGSRQYYSISVSTRRPRKQPGCQFTTVTLWCILMLQLCWAMLGNAACPLHWPLASIFQWASSG